MGRDIISPGFVVGADSGVDMDGGVGLALAGMQEQESWQA